MKTRNKILSLKVLAEVIWEHLLRLRQEMKVKWKSSNKYSTWPVNGRSITSKLVNWRKPAEEETAEACRKMCWWSFDL